MPSRDLSDWGSVSEIDKQDESINMNKLLKLQAVVLYAGIKRGWQRAGEGKGREGTGPEVRPLVGSDSASYFSSR